MESEIILSERQMKRIALMTAYFLSLANSEKEQAKEKKEKEPREPRAKKPSVEEATDYFEQIGGTADNAEQFLDYHDSTGWKTAKGPIKDWRAAARLWMRREKEYARPSENKQVINAQTGDDCSFDLDEFVKLSQEHTFDGNWK